MPAVASIRWGSSPHTFELRSPDPGLLARAALVFRPWMVQALASPPAMTWTVTRAARSDLWVIHGDGAGTADVMVQGNAASAVTRIEGLALQRLIDGPPDILTFHAALVARGARGVLIVGPSESGKSTLACALWQRGWTLVGDDVALVDPATAEARSAPRRVSLRSASRDFFDAPAWTRILDAPSCEATIDGYVFHPGDVDGRPCVSAPRLAACMFLSRRGTAPAESVRLVAPAHAALALLPYSNLIRRSDPGHLIARLSPLAARMPAYDFARRSLPDMVAAVEGIIDRAC